MDAHYIYASGKPTRRIDVNAVFDSIADQLLNDGDVEKALQRAFRFGTNEEMGLLDILDRLREESQEIALDQESLDQHTFDTQSQTPGQHSEDLVAMRDALRQVESLDDLKGLDPDLLERALTNDEREWIDKWADMTGQMIDSGLAVMSGPRLILTAKAIRQIGSRLLQHMFLPPKRRGRGSHHIPGPGLHGTPADETTEWKWGKPFDIHVSRSISNAVRRSGLSHQVRLQPEDFEVFERESGAAIHTVLLADMSRSMYESGAWDAAKRAAIALNALITTSRVHDQFDLIGFSGDARKLVLDELPSVSWDQFSHGTNLHAGLDKASKTLERRRAANQQVVIITDGEPTAFMDGDNPVFEHPVTERTIESTLLEAKRMSRRGINFTTICVGDPIDAPEFPRVLSRIVNGRLILLPVDELGSFLVRDVANGVNRTVR